MALVGRQRKPRKIPKAAQTTVAETCREWWIVEAPNVLAARACCAAWPRHTALPEHNAKVLNHRRNG